jgi:DNA-binding transcriptional regulator LsrR (DeoR family)
VDELLTLITKIAWAYHINNNTQQEIAEKLNISRVKVTRYLQKAKDMGIVKTTVSLEHGYCFDKEEQLRYALGLDDVVVIPSAYSSVEENGIGIAGANRINQLLTADDVFGVAWGFTLYSVAKNLEPVKKKDGKQIEVVQLMGGLTKSDKINPEEVVKMIASRLGAKGNWMNMPAIVGSKEARDILMNDNSVASVFEKTRQCTVCMLGLGNLTERSSLYMTGAYSKEDLKLLKEAGAVGDILSRPYDINGVPVKIPLSDRIIAVTLEQIKLINKRVAIAVGDYKVKAIIGACRGGYINELITDEDTAVNIIKYLEANGQT